ncbi:MAG: NAD(+)/NADH kinase [Alphaproteobacteria bacterium]|nr:NAD(+)/NADH kinase [Alphaproteobacteria bacterium]MBV9419416.1 NAD(+)/NADH kinase [Alphaproteobacteria bacterium]MBV9542022.1 NAD(+)/NADH kinase [Alphaproteobacteria bacterium]MBV9905272.1 NAD(+)/NADH kinase [Alphaproteobacteria bacterium]
MPNNSGTICCILNGGAGTAAAASDLESKVAELFAAHGARPKILVAHKGDDMTAMAAAEIERGASLVVAGGGDGTINAVASALIGKDVTFGVLPLGTLNHFAKDLNIPLALDAAIANLFTGRAAPVDAAEVNDRVFLNNSSLGLYPAIVRQREEIQKTGHGKWPAFVQAMAYALWRYSALHIDVGVAGIDRTEEKTPFIFIGNNRYEVAGLDIGKRARLDEGRLWVYRAPRTNRAGLFVMALRALFGRNKPRELQIFDAESFEVRTRRRHPLVSTDGEVVRLAAPLRYRIHPRALRVIVPAA